MGIEAALAVLNEMEAAGVMAQYAVGGAVAAFLYIEPAATFDLDVFITWKPAEGGLLTPQLFHQYLAEHGYGEYVRGAILIEGWAVQFLPLGSPLIEEAHAKAVPVEIRNVKTRVFTEEYLMAICLQTRRPKDMARLVQFVREGSPDMEGFAKILDRHDLSAAWKAFETHYL